MFHVCQAPSSLLNLIEMPCYGARGLASREAAKRQMLQLRTWGQLTPRGGILTNAKQETRGNSAHNLSPCCLLQGRLWGVILLAHLQKCLPREVKEHTIDLPITCLFNSLWSNGQWSNPSHHTISHLSLSRGAFSFNPTILGLLLWNKLLTF